MKQDQLEASGVPLRCRTCAQIFGERCNLYFLAVSAPTWRLTTKTTTFASQILLEEGSTRLTLASLLTLL
jgi:hypothetical protein